jgi:hypothetical protein
MEMPSVPGVRIVSDAMHDVVPEQYAMVIREMIRHENDLTNHRIVWLLIGEGFIANAYVTAKAEGGTKVFSLCLVGILIALSAFLMLYRSYQARGYLQFLGLHAKQGTLQEEQLPLIGWPRIRIKGWWKSVWVCPWFKHIGDLFEPWLLLPYVFISLWMTSLLYAQSKLNIAVVLMLGMILSATILSACCVLLIWSQNKEKENMDA